MGTSTSVTRASWIPLGPCIWKWSRSCRTCFFPWCELSGDEESVFRMAASWRSEVVILRATPRLDIYSAPHKCFANITYSWSAMSCASHTVEKAPWPNFWRTLYRGQSLPGHIENVSPRCTGWNPPGLYDLKFSTSVPSQKKSARGRGLWRGYIFWSIVARWIQGVRVT